MGNAAAIRTGTTAADTLLLQAYDTDTGPAYVSPITLTAGTSPTLGIWAGSAGAPAIVNRGVSDQAGGHLFRQRSGDYLWVAKRSGEFQLQRLRRVWGRKWREDRIWSKHAIHAGYVLHARSLRHPPAGQRRRRHDGVHPEKRGSNYQRWRGRDRPSRRGGAGGLGGHVTSTWLPRWPRPRPRVAARDHRGPHGQRRHARHKGRDGTRQPLRWSLFRRHHGGHRQDVRRPCGERDVHQGHYDGDDWTSEPNPILSRKPKSPNCAACWPRVRSSRRTVWPLQPFPQAEVGFAYAATLLKGDGTPLFKSAEDAWPRSGERDGCADYEQSKLTLRVKRVEVLEQRKYAALAAQVDAAVAAEKRSRNLPVDGEAIRGSVCRPSSNGAFAPGRGVRHGPDAARGAGGAGSTRIPERREWARARCSSSRHMLRTAGAGTAVQVGARRSEW